ncbi:chromosome partitioning protein ParB, partial [Rhizobiaceae sp. 2RAB30]
RYVEQRLRLASVSPTLLDVYAANGMTLAVLEAFTAHPDHARQEQVWDAVRQSHFREPWRIRQTLIETTVPSSDKRALFVGLDAYVAAGGTVLPRYLFDEDDDAWLEDVSLLDRLVADKLKVVADEVATEGWKWITVSLELPYGHDQRLRALAGTFAELTKKECKQREALRKEQELLETEYTKADELPEDVDRRLGEIEKELDAFERRPAIYDPAGIAIAGVFISVDSDGELIVDRGYVRPEDEPTAAIDGDAPEAEGGGNDPEALHIQRAVITMGGQPAEPQEDDEE